LRANLRDGAVLVDALLFFGGDDDRAAGNGTIMKLSPCFYK
jgi:hypothetical protein